MRTANLSWERLKELPHVRRRPGVARGWLTKSGMRFGDYLDEWPIAGVLHGLFWGRLMLDHGKPVCWTMANGRPRPEANRRGPPKSSSCKDCPYRLWEFSAPCRKQLHLDLSNFWGEKDVTTVCLMVPEKLGRRVLKAVGRLDRLPVDIVLNGVDHASPVEVS